jgi:DNA-binding LytR/AlgR family response regulator
MSLKGLEEKLATHRFVRIHKSYLVSVDKIAAVKRDLVSIGNTELPLSENYKPNLANMISF